jgi:calcineurin-like phosphoesterase family protein
MRVWFISDCHFAHANIIKYCSRPFKDAEQMDNAIINNWNLMIKKDDIIYCLGDFCLGNKEAIQRYVSQLNGRKNLILGNHDRYKPTEYMTFGFEWASRFPILFDNFMILSHEPVFLNKNCQPYINVHGHTHDSTPFKESGWALNISCEHTFYAPISYDMIKKEFAK